MAITTKCWKCVDLIAATIVDKKVYTGSLQDTAVYGDMRFTDSREMSASH